MLRGHLAACEHGFAKISRLSATFRSRIPRLPKNMGLVGEVPPPEGMYAHSTRGKAGGPEPSLVNASAAPFRSLSHKSDVDGYMQALLVRDKRSPRRRPTAYYHGAPRWDAPHGMQPPPVVIPADHAERLRYSVHMPRRHHKQ